MIGSCKVKETNQSTAVDSTARNSTRSHISGNERRYEINQEYVPFLYFTHTVSMGTSSITPRYDVEWLEIKTHVGLGPGESIEYIKHRVSLERCRSESYTWRPYSYGQTKQRGTMLVKWARKDCYLSRKDSGLQDRRGHLGCKTLQMDGEDQPSASQMSKTDTPLDHAQGNASGGLGSDSDRALQPWGGVR